MKARLGDDIVRCVGYGHIGDGNMHLNITSRQYNQEVMDKIEPYLYQWTSEQKGSISAEHGMIQLSFLFPLSRNQQCHILFIQCNPDLVTPNLVTNPDLVTILQKNIFLVHKNISFSDNLVFSAPSI